MNQKLCECGCGEPAPIAKKTWKRYGWVKGEPKRFVHGHSLRTKAIKTWGVGLWNVEERGYETPCWIWIRGRNWKGYGVFCNQTRVQSSMLAHRESYVRAYGPIADGLEIDHLCRNHPCVRPDHLEAVTNTENVRRGAVTKLSHEAVADIRESHRPGTPLNNKELAAKYGVTPQTIYNVLSGKHWPHEDGPGVTGTGNRSEAAGDQITG